ncbi:hypothetical protein MMC21_003442 [Puttea exsequens]|nr:hypothetical protein [Puttea exsequens]
MLRNATRDPLHHLQQACCKWGHQCKDLLQSSFDRQPRNTDSAVYPTKNGFVNAAIEAYSSHYHLRIRPEDIWFAILSQLSLWINAHAEEVPRKFIAYSGKKELNLTFPKGNCYFVDYGHFAKEIGYLIEQNIIDPELRALMMPAFTTSTKHDTVVASILMTGAM